MNWRQEDFQKIVDKLGVDAEKYTFPQELNIPSISYFSLASLSSLSKHEVETTLSRGQHRVHGTRVGRKVLKVESHCWMPSMHRFNDGECQHVRVKYLIPWRMSTW